jgi:hypothetical protein
MAGNAMHFGYHRGEIVGGAAYLLTAGSITVGYR